MATLSRLFRPRLFEPGGLASMALAAGLGIAALAPSTARADDDLIRVIVNVADVIHHGGYPYYRHGNRGYGDRLIVVRDRYGYPVYYRQVPRSYYTHYHGARPPYGNAHGYWKKHRPVTTQRVTCDRYGRCVTRYYDPRYDHRYYDNRYYGYNGSGYRHYGRNDRYWDGYRWRDRD